MRCPWVGGHLIQICQSIDDAAAGVSPPADEPNSDVAAAPSTETRAGLFDRLDWFAFCVTTFISFAVYWFTLAPEVTLEDSGELATAAKWLGVPHAPGQPAWTIYAWLFTKVIPFSNFAWRIGVSSAVAASLATGLVALMVSCLGAKFVKGTTTVQNLTAVEGRWLRLVSACVAGLVLAFSNSVWAASLIVDTVTFRLLLMSLIVCLMMRWFYRPAKRLPLYAACFLFGLASVELQLMQFAAPALIVMVLIGDMALGRDLAFGIFLVTIGSTIARKAGLLSDDFADALRMACLGTAYEVTGFLALPVWLSLTAWTHEFLTRWKATLFIGICLLLGLASLFYSPIASMTNPPMNWNYARSPGNFFHLVTRGQYEKPLLLESLVQCVDQIPFYAKIAIADLGMPFLLAGLIPIFCLHRMKSKERTWMLCLMVGYLFLSIGLVPLMRFRTTDSLSFLISYGALFEPAHLMLAIWSGCGLIFLGASLKRWNRMLWQSA